MINILPVYAMDCSQHDLWVNQWTTAQVSLRMVVWIYFKNRYHPGELAKLCFVMRVSCYSESYSSRIPMATDRTLLLVSCICNFWRFHGVVAAHLQVVRTRTFFKSIDKNINMVIYKFITKHKEKNRLFSKVFRLF